MPLSVGDKLGPYEILAPIGAGGMGEVYRAKDTKLKREVAIKVLPQTFSRDPERMARFQREAELLASLNHPNIATIYGVEDRALVMELVEGESPKGPLPFDGAWKIASQIAAALEYAHDKGIIHRDLKPANIKITPDGVVKLLDFGLAKAFTNRGEARTSAADMGPENSPTLTMGATEVGMILGTAAYMPPEQAKGKQVDKRADIWSFGVVLYELLTGERLFRGEDAADTLAQVLTKEPDLGKVPAKARKLLSRCLDKDPKKRLRDIGEAAYLVEDATIPAASAPAAGSRVGKLGWIAAAVLAVVAAATAWALWPKPPAPVKSTRFQILLPEKEDFGVWMAFSPDGRKLAFTTRGPQPGIWIRDLETLETRHLAGTESAAALFWSPDSRFLAFGGGGQLRKIDVSGGPPQTLCEAGGVGMGSWSRDGVVIFGASAQGPLRRVPASGGVPADVTAVNRERGEAYHSTPIFLPDGRHFLYLIGGSPEIAGIYVGSLDSKPGEQKRERLLATRLSAGYTPSQDPAGGRLFFMRDTTLMAQPFDGGRLQLTGEPVAVAEQLGISGFHGFFSVSPSGALAYRTGAQSAGFQLTWFDRQGKTQGTFGDLRSDQGIALIADGTRAAVRDAPEPAPGDIWTLDFARGVRTRLTFRQNPGSFPVWSPDGSRIAFVGNNWGTLYEKASSGAGEEKELLMKPGEQKLPDSWSRDGRFLLFHTFNVPQTGNDLWVLPMEGDRKPVLLLGTQFTERDGSFSPDMHWIAYTSNESGRLEVYVRPFTTSGASGASGTSGTSGAPSLGEGKWQVSRDGGELAKWRADGKELIFRAPNGSPMTVDVSATGAAFQAGVPKQLFALPPNVGDWDMTADGKRFLTAVPPGQQTTVTPITVVLNWQAALQK